MTRSSIDTFDPRGLMQREEPATSLHGGGDEYVYSSLEKDTAEEVKMMKYQKDLQTRHST